ncbi:MAG TPA: heavy metal-associated domain-containing protein [Kofleriaceae bacterium]|jgi:copper chaperone CopZ
MVTTLSISGMTCNHCVRHVGDALRGVPGVSTVEVRLPSSADVVHDDSASPAQLVEAVRSAGYEACHAPAGSRL